MFNYHCKDDCNNFPYRGYRRALSRIGDCIFGIMTDTNSSIGNLVPKESDDKSARKVGDDVKTLLGPFIHAASTDIYSDKTKLPQEVDSLREMMGFDLGAFIFVLEQNYLMATIIYVNENRTQVLIYYPSEPILAEAVLVTLQNDYYRKATITVLNNTIL
ncbi:11238_t:CDS:2 [Entrophospora sp. SA101]|nr:11238_t:CDS:2 [Entrophospora sp. SA101]